MCIYFNECYYIKITVKYYCHQHPAMVCYPLLSRKNEDSYKYTGEKILCLFTSLLSTSAMIQQEIMKSHKQKEERGKEEWWGW